VSKDDLAKALEKHLKWLRCETGGERANLRSANLRSANLSSANLSSANLSSANLRGADLSGADLSGADLSGADLSGADLRSADLRSADLRSANLRSANLSGANLSGALGIASAAEWLRANTKTTKRGCILAYKAFGNTTYEPPSAWKIEPGSYLTEVVNPCRGTECASGVNVGTLDFVRRNYPGAQSVWLVGIEPADIADVVVPFRTDGKFRAARVRLIRQLTADEIRL
jgi:hypothetical protein